MSKATKQPRGRDLIEQWTGQDPHHRNTHCPSCHAPMLTVALVKIAYTFEVCTCDTHDYPHLIETLWHRSCLAVPTDSEPTRRSE